MTDIVGKLFVVQRQFIVECCDGHPSELSTAMMHPQSLLVVLGADITRTVLTPRTHGYRWVTIIAEDKLLYQCSTLALSLYAAEVT